MQSHAARAPLGEQATSRALEPLPRPRHDGPHPLAGAPGDAIGLSPAQLAAFRPEWCSVLTPAGPRSPHRAADATRLVALGAYVDRLVTAKRAQAADDLLGRLVRARDDGRLTDSELASAVARLLVAAARGPSPGGGPRGPAPGTATRTR